MATRLLLRQWSLKYTEARERLEKHQQEIIDFLASSMIMADAVKIRK